MKLKVGSMPGPRASSAHVVDYLELICLNEGSASVEKMHRIRRSGADNGEELAGAQEGEKEDLAIDDWINEIERRKRLCPTAYPFEVSSSGMAIRIVSDFSEQRRLLYNFCLLATRMNMRSDKVQAGIDGTQLFERISACVSQAYVGPLTKSIVFGAGAAEPGFKDKIKDLCNQLDEGGNYHAIDATGSDQKDGKLDIVTWKPFFDDRPGKIVFFGQCKTGTNWEDSVCHLQPEGFLNKWISRPSIVSSIGRMFFVCDIIAADAWKSRCVDAGIMFDRLRICSFEEDLTNCLRDEIFQWTQSACVSTKINHLAGRLEELNS